MAHYYLPKLKKTTYKCKNWDTTLKNYVLLFHNHLAGMATKKLGWKLAWRKKNQKKFYCFPILNFLFPLKEKQNNTEQVQQKTFGQLLIKSNNILISCLKHEIITKPSLFTLLFHHTIKIITGQLLSSETLHKNHAFIWNSNNWLTSMEISIKKGFSVTSQKYIKYFYPNAQHNSLSI